MAPAAQEWFILYAVPKVAAEENDSIFPKFTNMSTFNQAPLPSHITIASNVVMPTGIINHPFIAAADRCGVLLLWAYTVIGITYYLCDPLIRRTLGIIPHGRGLTCRHSVGLIRNRSDKYLMVAGLNTWVLAERGRVTLSCTVDMYDWEDKECECSNIVVKRQWCGDGVLSHKGFLWWFDLSYCILACDPFADKPQFYKIMFPSVPDALPFGSTLIDGDVHRCLKVSGGRLRYVQIHGASREKPEVSMWTLSSSDPSNAEWTSRLDVPFEEIWDDRSYVEAGLRPRVVPAVALVHPVNASEVYFFLDTYIFSVNLTEKKVVDCQEFGIQVPPHKILSSRLVHAWQLPLELAIPKSGPDLSRAMEADFVSRWNSVEDFHTEAGIVLRSRPKLHDGGMEEIYAPTVSKCFGQRMFINLLDMLG